MREADLSAFQPRHHRRRCIHPVFQRAGKLDWSAIRSISRSHVARGIRIESCNNACERGVVSIQLEPTDEETNVAPIHAGNTAQIKLMGHSQIMRGHVDSIARAISVSNAQPNNQGVATVSPIFTWVRLAQRIPVRIHIDEVPLDIVLTAGMTATVEIEQSAPAK
jgi:hypothetical protein